MGVRIKIGQRHLLNMGKQISPDFRHYLLGCMHHQPIIGKGRAHTAQIQDPHRNHHPDQPRNIPRDRVIIDDRADKISACNAHPTADRYQNCNEKQQPLVISKISQQIFHGFFRIFRALIADIFCHYRAPPSCWE